MLLTILYCSSFYFQTMKQQLRIRIECTFGQLVHWWAILRSAIPFNTTIQKTVALVNALVKLHNFCINTQESENIDKSVPIPCQMIWPIWCRVMEDLWSYNFDRVMTLQFSRNFLVEVSIFMITSEAPEGAMPVDLRMWYCHVKRCFDTSSICVCADLLQIDTKHALTLVVISIGSNSIYLYM